MKGQPVEYHLPRHCAIWKSGKDIRITSPGPHSTADDPMIEHQDE
jgi:hypothetical protein